MNMFLHSAWVVNRGLLFFLYCPWEKKKKTPGVTDTRLPIRRPWNTQERLWRNRNHQGFDRQNSRRFTLFCCVRHPQSFSRCKQILGNNSSCRRERIYLNRAEDCPQNVHGKSNLVDIKRHIEIHKVLVKPKPLWSLQTAALVKYCSLCDCMSLFPWHWWRLSE